MIPLKMMGLLILGMMTTIRPGNKFLFLCYGLSDSALVLDYVVNAAS